MGGGETVRSWSNISKDILALILSKLCAGDAVAFYLVCKAWSKVEPHAEVERILSNEELCSCPCLIFPNKRLFHPLHNTWIQVDTIHELPTGGIVAQNHGWLIMNQRLNSFFFNPFTGDRIDLPDIFDWNTNFSTPPTSLDCVVFSFVEHQKVVFQSIKRGEDDISTEDVCSRDEFGPVINYKTVFFKGKYYCLGREGDLLIYDPRKYKCRRKKRRCRKTNPAVDMWEYFNASDCGNYLFEGEGDLWAVFIACEGTQVCVCKLDLNSMIWEKVHNLGDRTIFLSYESCLMVTSKVRGAGNKIYFPKLMGDRGHCLFYSLATKKYHTFEKGGLSYDSFHNSRDMTRCTWIQKDQSPSFESRKEEILW